MNTATLEFNPGIAYATYQSRQRAFIVAGVTAFLMSAYFVVGYMVGNIHFWQWNQDQWANALPGLGITFAMTAYQAILYSSEHKGAVWMTVLSICVAAGFSILSELGQGMERDNIRMEAKSVESPTYQAIIGSISGAASATDTPYSHDLQQAQARLASCQKKVQRGIYADCAESQARVNAVHQMIELSGAAKSSRALALAQTAKSMERDENNYHPLVVLMKNSLGVAGIVASFILSLTIIVFFEYAFHYLGRRYADARDELRAHGFDTTQRTRKTPRILRAVDTVPTPSPAPTPKPAHKANTAHLGTEEEQLQLPVTQEPVGKADNSEYSTVYAQTQAAKVGAVVACPHCGETFQKSNKWHLFCSNNRKPRADGGNCSDDWHNAQKPERLEVLKIKQRRAAA